MHLVDIWLMDNIFFASPALVRSIRLSGPGNDRSNSDTSLTTGWAGVNKSVTSGFDLWQRQQSRRAGSRVIPHRDPVIGKPQPSTVGSAKAVLLQASSSSIFFAAGSSFAMRKLRTSPARISSFFVFLCDDPLFHRACSMELSDDKSAFTGARDLPSPESAGRLPLKRQVAYTPWPS